MNLINFDKAEKQEDRNHLHFLLPNCHYMIVGGSGTGKTTCCLNMLLRWMNPDNITLYTLNANQGKYRLLEDFFNTLQGVTENKEQLFEILDPEDVVPIEDIDDTNTKVVVFDDIKIDGKHMKPIEEYFSLSRNKKCNCIYLTQSYYNTPKYIRRNTRAFCLFPGLDNKDITSIANDQRNSITREEFEDIYRAATEEPFSFMLVDKTSKHIPEMYRKNFDNFYIPNDMLNINQAIA